jgi:tRNA pseudouridine55 synthase
MFAVFNIYKPKDIDSFKVVKTFKRLAPKNTRIGHFGTLDPFAEGVLLIGVGAAARLNDYIHSMWPKTYLGLGLLGLETPTGDLTCEISQRDESLYLKQEIASFDVSFIQQQLSDKFVGRYMQSPHQYSAAKFEGKKLHEWARQGIVIKKAQVERFVHSLQVDSYHFPKLAVRYEVSSGTYIRTLFAECANHLGTIGVLEGLVRESVGPFHMRDSISFEQLLEAKDMHDLQNRQIPTEQLLPISKIVLNDFQINLLQNGQVLCSNKHQISQVDGLYWIGNQEGPALLLAEVAENQLRMKLKLH